MMLLSIASVFGIIFVFYAVSEIVYFSEPNVIASSSDMVLFASPFIIVFSFSLIITISIGFSKKQPIFGNRKFIPKFNEHTVEVYPLFSREFRENLSFRSKKTIKKIAIVVTVLLVLSVAVFPFGIYRRQVIYSSDTVSTYNSFDRVTHSARIADAEKMTVSVSKAYKRYWNYNISVAFDYGEEKYVFTLGSFGDMTREETLEYMLKLKALITKEKFEKTKAYRLEYLFMDDGFTPKEQALAYELFDVTK